MLDIMVLEVASYYPAPFCTRILASLGARVIKIETPAGEPTRAFEEIFAVFNLGKEILRVDLKNEEGKKKFFGLVEKADVIVEGLRPGVAKKLGIDYESISKINPGIIYCSITAFGQKTRLARFPAHDINVLGLGGILEICGKGSICDPNIQFADLTSSLIAVIAILSALIERERTGVGKRLDISMLRSSIFSLPVHATSILNGLGLFPVLVRNPVYGIYKTKDGYITLGIVAEEHFWRKLCETLELKFNFSILSALENFELVKEELAKKIGSFTTKEIIEKLRFADVPAFEVYSLQEIDKLEEALGEKLVEEINFNGKKVRLVKPPW
ncbi:MAG: CaiB/BaiF CoA-transferase family protein [Archaeoglobaceae archaeon]|nr:CaiB/BaiF CoA-transferase family protein [Archaeoglobales archaeon]